MELVWSQVGGGAAWGFLRSGAGGEPPTPREPPMARMCLRYPIDEKKITFYKLGEKEVGFGAWR